MNIQHLQPVFDLLQLQPVFDPKRQYALAVIEQRYGIALGESFRQFFSLRDAEALLAAHTSYHSPMPLEQLGSRPDFASLEPDARRLVQNRRAVFIFAESLFGELQWFVTNDGSADPKVVFRTDVFPEMLMPHPHHFSALLYWNIWDKRVQQPAPARWQLYAEATAPLHDFTLQRLRFQLDQMTSTFYLYAGRTIHRFYKHNLRLNVWDENATFSRWYFATAMLADLQNLLALVQKTGIVFQKIEPLASPSDTDKLQALQSIIKT